MIPDCMFAFFFVVVLAFMKNKEQCLGSGIVGKMLPFYLMSVHIWEFLCTKSRFFHNHVFEEGGGGLLYNYFVQ